MNSHMLVIILVLTYIGLTVSSKGSTEQYEKCSGDLWKCRRETCKSRRGKKHHHWVCQTLCWGRFETCMLQIPYVVRGKYL
ncbi:hypothetical protein ScPMuIL_014513 [Solemya velum]